jgi:hypothetical protein
MVKSAAPAVNAGAMTVKRKSPYKMITTDQNIQKRFSRDQPLAT